MFKRYTVLPLREYDNVYQVVLMVDGEFDTVVYQGKKKKCEELAFIENAYLIESELY